MFESIKRSNQKKMTKDEKWKTIWENEDVDAEMKADITDGNWIELEIEEEEPTSLPPKIGFEDVSFSELENLDS